VVIQQRPTHIIGLCTQQILAIGKGIESQTYQINGMPSITQSITARSAADQSLYYYKAKHCIAEQLQCAIQLKIGIAYQYFKDIIFCIYLTVNMLT